MSSVKFRETVETDGPAYDGGPRRYDDGPRYPPPPQGDRYDRDRDDGDRYKETRYESDRFDDRRGDDRRGGDFQERSFREETTTRVDDGGRTRDFADRAGDRVRGFRDRVREGVHDFGDRFRSGEREFTERAGESSRQYEGQEHQFGEHASEHKKSKHPTLHRFGEAITKGEGANGYLAAYLKELEKNPLRTKMLTSGVSHGLQELLASWIAQDRNRNGNYFTSRVPRMAVYGGFIAAPVGHLFVRFMHFLFAHRTSLRSKILQILFSNLIVSPIQNSLQLVAIAIVAGARTFHQIRATVRAGFLPVMRVSWIASPLCLAFAQQFLPEEYWVPFFNVVAFAVGVYVNYVTKKKRLAALRRRREQEREYGGAGGNYARTETRSEFDGRSTGGRPF
ncbi:MAG: hypothetical protein Q9159_001111 [Coniocarpon cinnabarinum]